MTSGLGAVYVFPIAMVAAGTMRLIAQRALHGRDGHPHGSGSLDVSGLNGPPVDGTHMISWPCKTGGTTNQIWKFLLDGSLYSLQPNNTQTRRGDLPTPSSGGVVVLNPASSEVSQDWQVQVVGSGLYQFVSASSGLCLAALTPNGDVQAQPCSDTAGTQYFMVSPYLASASCAYTQMSSNSARITLTWSTTNPQTLKFLMNGVSVAPTSTSGSSATFTLGATNGTQSLQITDSSSSEPDPVPGHLS